MSKLIIAEKPSVAKSIASALGASSRVDGFYESNGLLVCAGLEATGGTPPYRYVGQTAQDIFGAVPPYKVLCPLFIRRTAYLPC